MGRMCNWLHWGQLLQIVIDYKVENEYSVSDYKM